MYIKFLLLRKIFFDDEKVIKIIWWNICDVLKIVLGFIYKCGLFLFVVLGKKYVLIRVNIFYFIRVVFNNINFK